MMRTARLVNPRNRQQSRGPRIVRPRFVPRLSGEAIRNQRRAIQRASTGQVIFGLIAILVVCALIGSSVATIGGDLFSGRGGDRTTDNATEVARSQQRLIEAQRATVEANPQDASAMALLAQYLQVSGNPGEAIEWYTKALQINPNDTSVRLNFAAMLVNANKQGDAEFQYQKVLEIDPNNLQAMFWLGDLYQYWTPAPRTPEAVSWFQRVMLVGPGSVLATQAQQRLQQLGAGTPVPGTPVLGTPVTGTPAAGTPSAPTPVLIEPVATPAA